MTTAQALQLDAARMVLAKDINANPKTLEQLQAVHGGVWSTAQLTEDFEVEAFAAPFVIVKRRSDGAKGSLFFQHDPRFYFLWEPDNEKGSQ